MNGAATARVLRRGWLPAATFASVLAAHYLWLGVFSAQARWVAVDEAGNASWLRRYLESGNYWLGASYAISLAFAVVALRRYREERFCGAPGLAVGGATLSGFFALAGCYLVGCCGSPMLAVYLTLFGAAFLPLTKSLVFGFTVVCIAIAWWLMNRARQKALVEISPVRATTPDNRA